MLLLATTKHSTVVHASYERHWNTFVHVTFSSYCFFSLVRMMGRLLKSSKIRLYQCFAVVVLLMMCTGFSIAVAQEVEAEEDHQRPHPIVQFFQMHRRDRPQQNHNERVASSSSTENVHREYQRQIKECETRLEEQQRQYRDIYREHVHLVKLYEEVLLRNVEELKELRTALGAHDITSDVNTLLQMQSELMTQSQRMHAQLLDRSSKETELCHCNISETVPPLLKETIRELHVSHIQKMESLLVHGPWLERIESAIGNQSCIPSQPEIPTDPTNDQVRALENEKSALMGEYHLLQSLYEKMEMKYEAILRNYNDTLQEYLDKNLEEAVQNYSGVWIRELQATIRATNANCTASLSALQHEMDWQKENLTLVYQELEDKFSSYQETATEKLQLVLDLNEDLKKSNEDTVRRLKSEHQLELESTRASEQEVCAHNMDSLFEAHGEEVQQLTEIMTNCSNQLEVTELQLRQANRELEHFRAQHHDSVQRAEYWEQAYAKRSYFNITYLLEDVQQYLTELVFDARQQLQQKVVEPTVLHGRNLFEHHVAPVVRQSNAVYEEQLRPHIQQSYELYMLHVHPRLLKMQEILYPYYVLYLEPHLMTLRRHGIDFRNRTVMFFQDFFDDISLQYAQQCPKVVASLASAKIPPSVLHHVEHSCQQAHQSVVALLLVVSILLLLVFRRTVIRILWYLLCSILRMVWYMIMSPIRLLWFINPIRLLFFRRHR